MTRTAVVIAVAGSVLIGSLGARAATSDQTSVRRKAVAPGVVYRRIVDSRGPWIIHVLKIDPNVAATVDTVLAGDTFGSYAVTSDMAKGSGAIAAVNGDFGGRFGLPTHPWAGDGSLITTGMFPGAMFGLRSDKSGGDANGRDVKIWAKDRTSPGTGIGIASWNMGWPVGDQVSAYTSYGASKITPPTDACHARLDPKAGVRWGKGGIGVTRNYVVKTRWCGQQAMAVRAGTIVVSSRRTGRGADWIRGLARADDVRLRWHAGMSGVLDVVGGNPLLLRDGRLVARVCQAYLCQRHPRTAIGVTRTGTILLVVVDGRRSTSVGMIPRRLATYMRSLGAIDAINLDGGGSSTMWVKGLGVVNDPTDGRERLVTNAVVVLPRGDAGEPVMPRSALGGWGVRGLEPPGSGYGVVTGEARARAIALAMNDPASTGGLADLLAHEMNGAGSVSPAIMRIAARFRQAR